MRIGRIGMRCFRMMSNEAQRYELYLANLNPTMGSEIRKTRSVVIVSDNSINEYLETVVVCPLTTQIHAPGKVG